MSRILHAYVGTFEPIGNLVPNDFGFPITENPTPFLRALTLKIAGVDRSGFALADSWSGRLQLEGRDEASGELVDLADSYRPSIGESVDIISNTNLLYRGQITETEESYRLEEDRTVRHIRVRTSGAGHALDRRLVKGDITSNTLFTVLIQTLQPNGIHDDIWGSYDFAPFPGPQIETQRFNYTTALQAVQRIVNAAGGGWTWWLDWTGNYPLLHVRDLSTDPVDAPWDVTDSDGNIVTIERVRRDDSDYANRVYVRSEFTQAPTIIDTFAANGIQKSFGLDFPPLEIKSITLDGVAQTFGTITGDRETGNDTLEYYYQPVGLSNWWSQLVDHRSTFDSTSTPPTGSLVIKYLAQTKNLVRSDNPTEQAAKAAAMGFGSGLHEKVIELKDIASVDAAQEYADASRADAEIVPNVVEYSTFKHGMRPGRTQTINITKHGINSEFNISSVSFREVTDSYEGSEIGVEYRVEATSATKAVPHPGRLFEDVIDAIRGGSDPATQLGGGAGSGIISGGSGLPIWEVPRDSGDGITWYTSFQFGTTATNPHGVIVFTNGRVYNPFIADYTAFPDEAKFTFATGVQPQAGEQIHVVYWPKDGVAIANPELGARLFAGSTDVIDYGAHAEHYLQDDLSIGVWVKFNSSTVNNEVIITRGVGDGSITVFGLLAEDAGGEWGIKYFHDTATNQQQGVDFDLDLNEDTWYYIGVSKTKATKSVFCYVGDGNSIITTLVGFYNLEAGGTDTGTRNLGVGGGFGGFGSPNLHGTIQEHYVWSRAISKDEHLQAMAGNPPQTGLVLAVRTLGNSPEVDESSVGASGTVTGTTVVAGH